MQFKNTMSLGVTCALLCLSGCQGDYSDVFGKDQTPAEQEAELRTKSAHAHQELEDEGAIYKHPQLQSYITSVARKMISANDWKHHQFQFYVIKNPLPNAFAMPNGNIYLTLGLLAKVENELELAFVIAHESAHVTGQHSLARSDSGRTKMIVANVTDLLLMGTRLAYIPAAMSMLSYSREQEHEADMGALQALSRAGYDLTKVEDIFARTTLSKVEEDNSSIWSTHPGNTERKEAIQDRIREGELAANRGGKVGADAYSWAHHLAVRENIMFQLGHKLYASALDSIEYLIKKQPTASAYFLKGEALRGMSENPEAAAKEHKILYGKSSGSSTKEEFENQKKEFQDAALESYRKSLSLDANYVGAHKGIGLIEYARGNKTDAKQHLRRYISLGQNADDRKYIQSLIGE